MTERLAIFAYGSLASRSSVERTLGRPVAPAGPSRLAGWRRRWSQARDNLASEKTFARADDATVPPFCLGLNVERAPGPGPNGVLIEVSERELERIAERELRYDRVDVTAEVDAEGRAGRPPAEARQAFERVFTFTAKPNNFAPTPPPGAVILASYARAVEGAFELLGPEQLDLFRETTGPCPVEVIEAVLVRDQIPPGNPRAW